MLFLQANIGIVASIIFAFVLVTFFPQIGAFSLISVLLLIYIDITLHSIAFEYQRVSLILARIAKFDNSNFSSLSIPEIQILISSASFSTYFFFTFIITGFILAYLYLHSLAWLGGYLVVKYLISSFIPTYKPYKLIFKFMGDEFKKLDLKDPANLIHKAQLNRYYDEMPHTGKYEDWAFNKYGSDLLKVK